MSCCRALVILGIRCSGAGLREHSVAVEDIEYGSYGHVLAVPVAIVA